MDKMWNPWHGCHKYSEGCLNCYMFSFDKKRGVDSNIIYKTREYNMPIRRDRQGVFKLPAVSVVSVCLTSDFFLEEADQWREDAWKMIKFRSDVTFVIFTKRCERIKQCLPPDWGEGYHNVEFALTCENQRRADERLPIYLDLPIESRAVLVSPMIEEVNIEKYLQTGKIKEVYCSGENYDGARPCRFEWVESLREQCLHSGVKFIFHHTGSNFIKDGKRYNIPYNKGRQQAQKAFQDR